MAAHVGKNTRTPHSKKPSHSNNNDSESKPAKRPFDKKQWRLQKYKKNLGNVSEGQGFADKRKQLVVREYHKILKKEKRKQKDEKPFEKPFDVYSGDNTSDRDEEKVEKQTDNRGTTKMKLSAYKRAQLEYKQQEEEKEKKRQELLRIQREREDALKKYKERKIEKIKKLSRKTRKGQPVMKDRMELLLERIQRQVAADK